MEIKIVAIAPNDGWGFIEKEGKISLLRPPYTSSNQTEVSWKFVENAIHLHGFDVCDIALNSVNEVVRYLKETYIESKKKQGVSLPSSEQLRELLKYATDDVLLEYLERAEKELIPEGKLDAAESIASELRKLERVRTNPKMLESVIEILEKCNKERKRMEEELAGEISNNREETWKDKFPDVVGTYPLGAIINHQKKIVDRGQILPVGC
jgi:hypothetical protein